ENDIEGACARSDAGDILSRLLCAVHGRGVTPAGSDGPLSPAHAIHAHTPSHPAPSRHDDPQLSTAAHTDMLLLNLMRINGLTPKCPKNVKHGPKRNWSSCQSEARQSPAGLPPPPGPPATPRLRPAAARNVISPKRNWSSCQSEARQSPAGLPPPPGPPATPAFAPPPPAPAGPTDHATRRSRPDRCRGIVMVCSGASWSSPPVAGSYWASASSLSDTDDVEVILDYNDTLFDMLLNSLSLEGSSVAECDDAPPVQPWSPAREPRND
ncbi:hypothetical protein KGM_200135B, partial [Danaus plexippus plexippus]